MGSQAPYVVNVVAMYQSQHALMCHNMAILQLQSLYQNCVEKLDGQKSVQVTRDLDTMLCGLLECASVGPMWRLGCTSTISATRGQPAPVINQNPHSMVDLLVS